MPAAPWHLAAPSHADPAPPVRTPRRGEAMAYSLLMSAFNLGLTASDLLGSRLYDTHHVSLPALICVSAGTTLLCLLALPLIPRTVLERPDRAQANTPR